MSNAQNPKRKAEPAVTRNVISVVGPGGKIIGGEISGLNIVGSKHVVINDGGSGRSQQVYNVSTNNKVSVIGAGASMTGGSIKDTVIVGSKHEFRTSGDGEQPQQVSFSSPNQGSRTAGKTKNEIYVIAPKGKMTNGNIEDISIVGSEEKGGGQSGSTKNTIAIVAGEMDGGTVSQLEITGSKQNDDDSDDRNKLQGEIQLGENGSDE